MERTNQPCSKNILKAILILGLLVGTFDILSAIIDYYVATGKNPSGIFKYISSAIVGNKAFTGGAETILLGLLLHYVIAFSFTILFVYLTIKTNISLKNKFLTGVLYGILIWAVMNFIVVPLSATPKFPFNFFKAIKAMLILICMIGLPLSFLTGRFVTKREPNA